MLVALANAGACDDEVRLLLRDIASDGATPVLVVGAAPTAAQALLGELKASGGIVPFTLCDGEQRFLRVLLAPDSPAAAAPQRRVLVLDANQRLLMQGSSGTSDAMIAAVRGAIAGARADRPADSLLFGSAAPVLVLPRVFEPEFCRRLIELWSSGERADGGVSSRYGNVMAADRKRTEDHIVRDATLNKEISDRLAYRIGPELAKAFGWDWEFAFDAHVIISYSAEGGHYFRAHRDNSAPQTADRAFAVSLNLNDDFEGGELVFPEYGPTRYKPKAGAAAVFSCSLLHEALPVTRGRRFVVTTFFRNRGRQGAPQLPG
jgi:predicted 2-oxoglutarate/Fe(II)-dependent dioxygenase YbiX